MRAPAGARSLLRVLFERKVATHRGHLRSHDVCSAKPPQSALRLDLRIALARRGQQEPSQKNEPDTVYTGMDHERQVHPKSHHAVSDGRSDALRNAWGSRIILGDATDYGAEDAASVEREARQPVESRQKR